MVVPSLLLLATVAVAVPVNQQKKWKGWAQTKYYFQFGDSYTTSAWNPNPGGIDTPDPGSFEFTDYPHPNWAESLAHQHNLTNTRLFNFAIPGSTINNSIVCAGVSGSGIGSCWVPSVTDQLYNEFKPWFVPAPAEVPWDGTNSLFSIWVGVNDIGNSQDWTNISQPILHERLLTAWDGLVEQMYNWGARAFLLLDVPPTDRSESFTVRGPKVATNQAHQIVDFNTRQSAHVARLQLKYPDAVFMHYSSWADFTTWLNGGRLFGFDKTSGTYCPSYENGTVSEDTFFPECGYPVSGWFWLNPLHPAYRAQNLLSANIGKYLRLF